MASTGKYSTSTRSRLTFCASEGNSESTTFGPTAAIGRATMPVHSAQTYSSTARTRCHTRLRRSYWSWARVIASTNDDIADEPDQRLSTNPIETTSPRAVVRIWLTVGAMISWTALLVNTPLVVVTIHSSTAVTVLGPNQPPT